MTRDSFITIPRSIEGLEEAAREILDENNAGPVLEGLRARAKWQRIKEEYRLLKKKSGGAEAIRRLSEKYHYSEKTIEKILYGG